jgi:hypothetical protein
MSTSSVVPKFREPVNIMLRLVLAATGVPQRFRGVEVPPGCTVYLRGHNGAAAGNVAPIKVGVGPDEAASGPNRTVAPNTQISYPVQNTRDICIVGTLGDGAEVSIIGG